MRNYLLCERADFHTVFRHGGAAVPCGKKEQRGIGHFTDDFSTPKKAEIKVERFHVKEVETVEKLQKIARRNPKSGTGAGGISAQKAEKSSISREKCCENTRDFVKKVDCIARGNRIQ